MIKLNNKLKLIPVYVDPDVAGLTFAPLRLEELVNQLRYIKAWKRCLRQGMGYD